MPHFRVGFQLDPRGGSLSWLSLLSIPPRGIVVAVVLFSPNKVVITSGCLDGKEGRV